jgi:hypothetical protein
MAKIPEASLQTYSDGDKVYALDYNRDRDVFKVAINDIDDKATSVQTQLNTIIVNGDSSVESAQARVNANGLITYSTLKARLDAEYNLLDTKIITEKNALKDVLDTKIDSKFSGGTGYKVIDGLLFQWGVYDFITTTGSLDYTIAFPEPFIEACYNVSGSICAMGHQSWISSGAMNYVLNGVNGRDSVRFVHFGGVPNGPNYRLLWNAFGV